MVSSHLDLEGCGGEEVCLLGCLHHSRHKPALYKIIIGCRSKTKLTYLTTSRDVLVSHLGEVTKAMVENHLPHQNCDCGLHVSVL